LENVSSTIFLKYRCKTSKLEIHKVVGPNAALTNLFLCKIN